MIMIGLAVLATTFTVAVYLIAEHLQPSKALLLGSGVNATKLVHDYESSKTETTPHFNIVAHVCTDECGCSLPHGFNFDTNESLLEIAKKSGISTILIAASSTEVRHYTQQLLDCKLAGIKIVDAKSVSFQSAQKTDQFSYLGKMFHPFG